MAPHSHGRHRYATVVVEFFSSRFTAWMLGFGGCVVFTTMSSVQGNYDEPLVHACSGNVMFSEDAMPMVTDVV